jgi:hypothetical protein
VRVIAGRRSASRAYLVAGGQPEVVMRARVSALLAALALAGCGDSGSSSSGPGGLPVPGQGDYVLAIGQEVRVDSLLRLSVTGVPQDSRCALQAMCVWAGDGAVAIAYGIGMGPSYPDTLHTMLDPKATAFGGYRITLVELAPYPVVPGGIEPEEYRATIRVERLPG